MNFNGVTLQHNNEFIIIFCYFIIMVSVITMCNLIKRSICATFLSTPARDVDDENKLHGQAIRIAERLLTINKRNIIR